MFDIISKDALRQAIEAATENQVTVLYDNKGIPCFMCVIPKMTIGDCFPLGAGDGRMDAYMSETHPAFKLYDSTTGDYIRDLNEIFVSQFRCSWTGSGADFGTYHVISVPGRVANSACYKTETPTYPIRGLIEGKGPNWHVMNIWEYMAIVHYAYKNNINIPGISGAGVDYDGKSGVIYQMDLHTTALSDPGFEVGETITGDPSGSSGTYLSSYVMGGSFHMRVGDLYGPKFAAGDTITGETSGKTTVIGYITANCIEGGGPLTWFNNHKFTGVWGLAYSTNLVDGMKIRKKNVSGTNVYMIMSTDGNYYNYDEDVLLKTHAAKISRTSASAPGNLRLGYQLIDGAGDPIAPYNETGGDYNISDAAWGTLGELMSRSTYYNSTATATVKKDMTLLGWDPIVFPDSDQVDSTQGSALVGTVSSETDRICTKGQIYAVGADNGVFSTYAYSVRELYSLFFRCTYIP